MEPSKAKPWVSLVLEIVRVVVATLAGFFGGGGNL